MITQPQQFRVGQGGIATRLPDMDFETYSEAGYVYSDEKGMFIAPPTAPAGKRGLFVVGAAVYAEHPSTEVLSLAYDLKDGVGSRLWVPGLPPPQDLFDHIARGGLLESHHSGFEFLIWHYVCNGRMGWPVLPLLQQRCSMAKARAWSLPGALEKVANIVSAPVQKDTAGGTIMKQVSAPRKPTKALKDLRYTPVNAPEKFSRLYLYNIDDIRSEESVSLRIPDLSPDELRVWQLDQEINMRGVHIDRVALDACLELVTAELSDVDRQLHKLTDGMVEKVTQVERMEGWMASQGYPMTSLGEDAVQEAIKRNDAPPAVHRLLGLRALGGSAGIKKLFAMHNTANQDNRIRGLLAYCGADRTGRWAGRGVQVQNLQNSGPEVIKCPTCDQWMNASVMPDELMGCPHCKTYTELNGQEWNPDAMDQALADIVRLQNDPNAIRNIWGDIVPIVAACLRGLFSAAPGCDFISSDYSAIEAVVMAAMAGEEWRMEVFRTHGKIYEMGASRITGVPFDEFIKHKQETGNHHPLRKKIGKVSELASGYAGWIGAWKNFGADKFLTDDEIKEGILKWRDASPAIVEFWGGQLRKARGRWEFTPELFGLEGAFVSAVLNPGKAFAVGSQYGQVVYQFDTEANVLYCQLPSGRRLNYHRPQLRRRTDTKRNNMVTFELSFEGWNSDYKKGPKGWMRIDTYSGKLAENVIQAIARDILAYALVNLNGAGYSVVMHVHDEVVSEVPEGTGTVEDFERIMSTLPPWASNWPVKASGGWRGKRFRK